MHATTPAQIDKIKAEIARLGADHDGAGSAECICAQDCDDGRVRLYDDQASARLGAGQALEILGGLPDGAGTEAVWEALGGYDD